MSSNTKLTMAGKSLTPNIQNYNFNQKLRIGPETGDARIMWARFPALLGFMQLAEAEQTMTDMVVAGMQKFAVCMNNMLTANYTGNLHTLVLDW